ncbi:unnamed protein product [Rotaria socialis]|uniref:Transposase n=2 Tax=Rotaria socialis TaxID=392032 RepID=A0A817YDS6_9BILA|nr:unnamed protein product [Rotaria socialis]
MDEKSPFQEKKIPVSDLYEALQHNEKLDKIPDTIETNRIYRVALASNTKDAYKFDKYAWKNTRRTPYPKNNPEFIKIYYSCVNADKKKDGRCVKHVFISKVNDLDVLVCYFGNFYIAEKRPHGNCRLENSHVFHHTPASTIAQIDELVSKMPGAAAYKTLVATNGDVEAPRNAAQCQYRRQKYLKNQKITCDEIKNLILLSYELNGFYKLLQLQPETSIVLMHDQMKQQFASNIEWNHIIWSDAAHFEVLNRKNRTCVRRLRSEADQRFNFVPNVQGGEGSISVWGCMAGGARGPLVIYSGKVDGRAYVKIIEELLPSFIENAFDSSNKNWMFMHDNAPPHRSKYVE